MQHTAQFYQKYEFPDGNWDFMKRIYNLPMLPRIGEYFNATLWIAGHVQFIKYRMEKDLDGQDFLISEIRLEDNFWSHGAFSEEMVEMNDGLKEVDEITNLSSPSKIKSVYLQGEKPIFSEFY